MKAVKTKSGIIGWQDRLRKVYGSLESLQQHNKIFDIRKRLGYPSCQALWDDNPIIQGSVVPTDLCVVVPKVKKPLKEGAVPRKLRELAKLIKVYGIDGILFDDDTFVYQYRINGADCTATCFLGKKQIDDNYDVTMEIGNLLHSKIKKAYMDGSIEGKDIMAILAPLNIKCYAFKFGQLMKVEDQFEVEGGSDS